jgi:hypothetical protein
MPRRVVEGTLARRHVHDDACPAVLDDLPLPDAANDIAV